MDPVWPTGPAQGTSRLTSGVMVDKDRANDPVVAEDERRLEHLEEEIEAAKQELRKETHEDEPRFYDEGDDSEGPVGG